MSLINQMLKDIDQRQGGSGSVPADVAGLRLDVPRARTGAGVPVRTIGALAALLALAAGVYWLRQPVVTAVPAAVSVALSAPSTSPAPAPAPVTPVAQVPPPPVTPAAAPVQVPAPMPAAAGMAAAVAVPAVPAPSQAAAMAVQDKRRDAEKTPAAAPRAQSDAPAPVGLVSRQVSTEQRADNTYREAVALVRQGRTTEAQGLLRQALADMPAHHEARLLHARLLAGDGRSAEARSLLGEGLGLKSPPLAMYTTLAQAQLLARDAESAVTTLERGLPQAGENAEYHALLAAALQQQDRHADAVQHYLVALRQFPDAANWLVGLGVSLQATRNPQGAAEAYQHGIELGLPSALTQFARERLEQLKR